MRPYELDPLPEDVELPPETGTTFADNALGKARAAAGRHRAAGDRRRLRHRGGRARRRAGRVVGPLRRRGRHATRRTWRSCCARCRRTATAAWPTCARSPTWSRAGARRSCTGAARARSRPSRAATAASATTPPSCPDDYPGDERTMAELTPQEKDAISHRGRAARALVVAAARRPRRPSGPPARCGRCSAAWASAAAEAASGERGRGREAGELADAHARRRTALVSVAAAVFLVAVKLVTAWRPGRSRSSPRRSTPAPTWWRRCSPCSRCASRCARPTASTTTATARPSTWPRSGRARS